MNDKGEPLRLLQTGEIILPTDVIRDDILSNEELRPLYEGNKIQVSHYRGTEFMRYYKEHGVTGILEQYALRSPKPIRPILKWKKIAL
ncbi:MAG: hypothetical protein ACI8Y7_000869 [Candidatus Woesearchaeota archaeon]|jgi:hypothetical protein